MSKRAEEAIAVFHNQALLEAHKYAQPYGGGFSLEIAHGRGLKTGFIQGYEQAEKDTIERAIKFIETFTHPDDVSIRNTLVKAFLRHMEEE